MNWSALEYEHLKVLRVSTDGTYDDPEIMASWIPTEVSIKFDTITNADQGIVVSWSTFECVPDVMCNYTSRMATVTGTSISLANAPQIPGQSGHVVPVLQAQDGSFVGTVEVPLSSRLGGSRRLWRSIRAGACAGAWPATDPRSRPQMGA